MLLSQFFCMPIKPVVWLPKRAFLGRRLLLTVTKSNVRFCFQQFAEIPTGTESQSCDIVPKTTFVVHMNQVWPFRKLFTRSANAPHSWPFFLFRLVNKAMPLWQCSVLPCTVPGILLGPSSSSTLVNHAALCGWGRDSRLFMWPAQASEGLFSIQSN